MSRDYFSIQCEGDIKRARDGDTLFLDGGVFCNDIKVGGVLGNAFISADGVDYYFNALKDAIIIMNR